MQWSDLCAAMPDWSDHLCEYIISESCKVVNGEPSTLRQMDDADGLAFLQVEEMKHETATQLMPELGGQESHKRSLDETRSTDAVATEDVHLPIKRRKQRAAIKANASIFSGNSMLESFILRSDAALSHSAVALTSGLRPDTPTETVPVALCVDQIALLTQLFQLTRGLGVYTPL